MVRTADIHAWVARVAAEFNPRRVVLFGPRAYGRPRAGSDVDLRVVMSHGGQPLLKAVEILRQIPTKFPIDLIVRTEAELRYRYKIEDWFMREIVDKGVTLYEAHHARMARKGRSRCHLRVASSA